MTLLSISHISNAEPTGSDNFELSIGQETNFYQLSANEAMYFQLKLVRGDFNGNEDLLIKVSSNEYSGDPDVYLSKVSLVILNFIKNSKDIGLIKDLSILNEIEFISQIHLILLIEKY